MEQTPNESRPVRFPLQTGEDALANVVVGVVLTLLGLFMIGWLGLPAFLHGGHSYDDLLPVGMVVISMAGMYVFFFGLMRLRRAYLSRASDVILSERGVLFIGGPQHKREIQWVEVDPSRCEVFTDQITRLSRTPSKKPVEPRHKLILAMADGDMVELAEAKELSERHSFEALVNALRAPYWYKKAQTSGKARAEAGRWRDLGLEVLLCPGCGAPCAPSQDAATRCAFCGGAVDVPNELRAKLVAAADVSSALAHEDHAVTKLLDQPSALTTSGLLFAIAAGTLVGVPLLFAILSPPFALIGIGIAAALYLGAHGSAIDRHALRVMSIGAAARGPELSGEPHLCRMCDAPLPATTRERLVVACSYCGAKNVLNIDLRGEVPAERAVLGALGALLAQRSGRRRNRALGIAAAALVAIAGLVIAILFP